MLALEWSRPAGFAALALPLLVLLLHRTFGRPSEVATGTLAIWREVQAARTPQDARARRSLPWRMIVALLAMTLGALALAGPLPARRTPPRTWRVVVDRSPSMYLAWRGPEREGDGATRLAGALATLEPWLAELVDDADTLLWIDAASGGDVVQEGPRSPAEWLAVPELTREAPAWELHDRPGAIFVTDRAPQGPLKAAGFVAAGGAAVPGLVGRAGRAGLAWDGERLVVVDDAELAPAQARVAGEVPDDLRALFELWTTEREVALVDAASAPLELELVGPGAGAREATRAGRDGWVVLASAAPADTPNAALETWLGTRERRLVGVTSGRIELAFDELTAIEGDLEAFALSWSRLFDAARRAPLGGVAFAERLDAGSPLRRAPTPPAREGGGGARTPYDAWLGLAAASLALFALGAPRARRRAQLRASMEPA